MIEYWLEVLSHVRTSFLEQIVYYPLRLVQ